MDRISYEQYKAYKPIWWWPLLVILPGWWILLFQFGVGAETLATLANLGMETCPPAFLFVALVFFLASVWSALALLWFSLRFLNTVVEGHYCRIHAGSSVKGWGMYKERQRDIASPEAIATIRVGGFMGRDSWVTVRDANGTAQHVRLSLRLRFGRDRTSGWYFMRVVWKSSLGTIVLSEDEARQLFQQIGPALAAAKSPDHTTAIQALLQRVVALENQNARQAQTITWRENREAWLMDGISDAVAAGCVVASHLNDAKLSPRRRENYDFKTGVIAVFHGLASMYVERERGLETPGLRHKLALAWHGAAHESFEHRLQRLRGINAKRDLSLMLASDVGEVEKARAALASMYVPEAPEQGSM